MTRILIVEDEESYREPLVYQLTREGYDVSAAATGEEGLELFTKGGIDLVLLDLMLPGLDGTALCRRIREQSRVPIIMLTAKSAEIDKVVGLEIGADDYITKPFAIQELLARIRAALRKHQAPETPEGERLTCKNLVLYPSRYEVTVNGEEIHLTKKEYSLLEYLLRNKRNVLTRDQILQEVWGYDYAGDTNVVDVYIRYLRAKIDERFGDKYIYTVRGVGYVIKD